MFDMDKFCTRCGEPMEEGMRFCVHCGFEADGTDPCGSQPVDGDQQVHQDRHTTPDKDYKQDEQDYRPRDSNSGIPPLPETRKKRPVVIIVGILIAALALTVGYYFVYLDDPCIMGDPDIIPSQTGDVNAGQGPEAPHQEILGSDYLPVPGLKLDYYERFVDGDEGPMTRFAAKLSPKILVSEADVFVDGNNEEFAWVTHYIQEEDGIYMVDDNIVKEQIKVLPAAVEEGATWTQQWPEGALVMTIIAVGVNCELDFTTIKNCVLIEMDNQAVGIKTLQYYAPGMGLVKEESPDGNQVTMEVTAYQQIGTGEAEAAVRKHAHQVTQLEALLQ